MAGEQMTQRQAREAPPARRARAADLCDSDDGGQRRLARLDDERVAREERADLRRARSRRGRACGPASAIDAQAGDGAVGRQRVEAIDRRAQS